MIDTIEIDFGIAQHGKDIWDALQKKYRINNEWLIVILVWGYENVNAIVLKKILSYLNRKYMDKVIFISVDKCQVSDMSDKEIVWEQVKKEEIQMLLKYYRLVQFAKNIVITAIEEPYGNWGIVGKADISLEDYVENAILI